MLNEVGGSVFIDIIDDNSRKRVRIPRADVRVVRSVSLSMPSGQYTTKDGVEVSSIGGMVVTIPFLHNPGDREALICDLTEHEVDIDVLWTYIGGGWSRNENSRFRPSPSYREGMRRLP